MKNNQAQYFKKKYLAAVIGMALAVPFAVGSNDANALIAATHIYHNHMPNFWPYYDTSTYASTPVGGEVRYMYDGQAKALKLNPPANYKYFLTSGAPMPHDDFDAYYNHDAKRNAYSNWPAATARANSSAHPKSQTQVTMSAAVINNIQSFAELGSFDFFQKGWAKQWQDTVGSLKTANGFNALEPIHFTGHHSMGPLVGPQYFLKDLIFQNVTLQQDYFLGKNFKSSKGFFPTELGFSERLIPTLNKLGIEWSVLGNNHFSRALKDYPFNAGKPAYDTLVSPPNRADLQNTFDQGEWVNIGMAHEQQNIVNKFPFASTPHWVQYVDPETGAVSKVAGIPVDQNGSWQEGWDGSAVPADSNLPAYEGIYNRPQFFVIAHDGDNSQGRAGSYDTWMNSGSEYSTAGVEGMGVQEYLKAYPIPADDIQHVQDGSWVDTRDSSSDPDWYHWHIPMGVWKGQLSDFNKANDTDFELPVNHAGLSFGHAVSLEYGYHYLERNFALLQAALNYAATAEQIWLDDHPNYWKPTTAAEKEVTYAGNQLNPYMMSFPVKGDENNDYKGGANPAELGWYFLISSIDSGFGYYDENKDDNVKPSLGFGQSLFFTEPYIAKNMLKDRTGPSMWWVQKYPTNPGSANAGKAEGWTTAYADNTWAVYTYAYDLSGIKDVKVFVRAHKAKRMSPTDIAPRVYDPKKFAGQPNVDVDQVGEWKEYKTSKRELTPVMNGVAWQDNDVSKNYAVLPGKKIGDTYYAYITDYRDQLVDYYMEATDSLGNVTRSEINHTYVGAGRYNSQMEEDVNGSIEGVHMFFTDSNRPVVKNVELWFDAKDATVGAAYAYFKDNGSNEWQSKDMTRYSDKYNYFTTSVSYEKSSGCADVKVIRGGSSAAIPSNSGECLAEGSWTIKADGSIVPGAPSDIVKTAVTYFKPSTDVSSACMHYRPLPSTGDSGWTKAPGTSMTKLDNGWYKLETEFGPSTTGMEFLFNNCSGSWYKTSAGGNFTVNSIDTYNIEGTKLSQGCPAGVTCGGEVVTNKAPTAKIVGDSSRVTPNTPVVLDGSKSYDPDGSVASYKWSTGETTAQITVKPAQTTTYTLVVTDNEGKSSTAAQYTVNVGAEIAIEPAFSVSKNYLEVAMKNATKVEGADKVSYSWDFGDGATSTEANPVHVYAESGSYTIKLTVSADGETKSLSQKISVLGQIVVNPVFVTSVNGSTVNFANNTQLSNVSGGVTYAWDFGDGTTSTEKSPAHTYANDDTYTVTLTVTAGDITKTTSENVVINTKCNPTLSSLYFVGTSNAWKHAPMSFNQDTCKWEIELALDGKGDSNGSQRFKVTSTADWKGTVWGNAGNNALCSNQASCGDVKVSEIGDYILAVDDTNMTWNLTKVADKNHAPIVGFEVVSNDKTVTLTSTSTDSDGDVLELTWDLGDGTVLKGTTVTHEYASYGNYTVKLVATDGELSDSVAKTVEVSEVVIPATRDAMFYAGTTNKWTHDAMTYNNKTGEWGIVVELTGKGDENGAQRFKVTSTGNWKGTVWGNAGGNKLCDNQARCGDVSTSLVGTYLLTVNDKELTWKFTKVDEQNHAPVAAMDVTLNDLTVEFADASVDADNDELTYEWDLGDGEISYAKNVSHTYNDYGTYTVKLTVSDGKTSSSTVKTVEVKKNQYVATRDAMYFASTVNTWKHQPMTFDGTTGNWTINVVFNGKGDANGEQRFKVTSTPDWKGIVWGNAGNHELCDNQDKCQDIVVDVVGSYKLSVNDKTLQWSLEAK